MTASAFARSCSLLAALAALALPSIARAQVPLIGGFGGTVGYGTSCLSPNDDGSSNTIDIRSAFPSGLRFFDRTHTSMFVNTNGNISFSGAVPTYTPNPFPVANQPMIAPYWADVDIRVSGGSCMGGVGNPDGAGRGACQNPPQNGVWWALEPGRIVVTWHRVGYFTWGCTLSSNRMSFQLILTAAPDCGGAGDFDVEFRYNECGWTTGDASSGSGGFGGTPAQAGFDAGNTRDFVEIMGSRMAGINTRLCTMSNVGMPGIWRFQIRRGTIMCPDAGRACSTGMQGVCAEGATQCVGSGTTCVRVNNPSPERCDGLDNDCNGMVDEGEELCPVGQRCLRGVCTSACVEGGCFDGYTCQAGVCVETACVDVTCPTGQRCRAGTCAASCDGVVCPTGQTCRAGRCVDPCDGLTCAAGLVCEDGVCRDRCGGCRMCPAGRTCNSGSGVCVETSCASVSCPSGQVCSGGACVDPCTGAVCPDGERCESGQCVPAPPPDAGVPPYDAGEIGEDASFPEEDAGNDGDDAGDAGDGGRRRPIPQRVGCACHVGQQGHAMRDGLAAVGLLAAAFAVTRRRRR